MRVKIIILLIVLLIIVMSLLTYNYFNINKTEVQKNTYDDGDYLCIKKIDLNNYYEYFYRIENNSIVVSFCNRVQKYNTVEEFNNDLNVIRYHDNEEVNEHGIYIFEESLEVKKMTDYCSDTMGVINEDNLLEKLNNASFECNNN